MDSIAMRSLLLGGQWTIDTLVIWAKYLVSGPIKLKGLTGKAGVLLGVEHVHFPAHGAVVVKY